MEECSFNIQLRKLDSVLDGSAVKVSLATVKNPARKFPEKSAVKVFMKSSIAQVEL